MICTKDVIDRIKKKLGIRFNKKLEEAMGLCNGQIRQWCKSNRLPIKLVEFCIKKGLSIDELLGIATPRYTAHAPAAPEASAGNVKTLRAPVPFYSCKTQGLSTKNTVCS